MWLNYKKSIEFDISNKYFKNLKISMVKYAKSLWKWIQLYDKTAASLILMEQQFFLELVDLIWKLYILKITIFVSLILLQYIFINIFILLLMNNHLKTKYNNF